MVLLRGWEWQQGSMLNGSEQQKGKTFCSKDKIEDGDILFTVL